MASSPFNLPPQGLSLTASIAISRLERNYLSPITLRRSDSFTDSKSPSQKSPEIFIYPPDDEPNHEACIMYLPNEFIVGLPNLVNSNSTSLLNAALQLFIALPLINEELPAHSEIQNLQNFTFLVRSLHCNYGPVTSKSIVPTSVNRSASIYTPDPNFGNTFGKIQTGLYQAPPECVNLDWLLDISDLSMLKPNECPPNISKIVSVFLQDIFSKTRFGINFSLEMIDISLKKTDSGIDVRIVDLVENTNSPLTTKPALPNGCEVADRLTISIGDFLETDSVNVVELINKKLGYANFFFGRPRSVLYVSASQTTSQTKQLKFTRLPTFLVLHFDRPYNAATGFHKTTIEMPEELDLGFYLAQGVSSKPNSNDDKSSAGGKVVKTRAENLAQKTFYRLHGFVTQIGGHFLTYTRLRNGSRWFKCDDEKIIDFELSTRVSSKGVLLALYKMQS
ncbi:hypothetical protein HK096_008552 [Nowakowskiella sp. JEL0078]|nr:hypothetical protein HK096_008552 [Nowakowskiella sp. JEL0078]